MSAGVPHRQGACCWTQAGEPSLRGATLWAVRPGAWQGSLQGEAGVGAWVLLARRAGWMWGLLRAVHGTPAAWRGRATARGSRAQRLSDRFTNHHCCMKRELGCLGIHPRANYCLPEEPDPSRCN